jgi:hypothetical protein
MSAARNAKPGATRPNPMSQSPTRSRGQAAKPPRAQAPKRLLSLQSVLKHRPRFVIAQQLLQKISAPSQKSLAKWDIFFRAANGKFFFANR